MGNISEKKVIVGQKGSIKGGGHLETKITTLEKYGNTVVGQGY